MEIHSDLEIACVSSLLDIAKSEMTDIFMYQNLEMLGEADPVDQQLTDVVDELVNNLLEGLKEPHGEKDD